MDSISGTHCVHCGHPGVDVRIIGCAHGCTFHARCFPLKNIRETSSLSSSDDNVCALKQCPRCITPASGMEIIPLSFEEIDQARRLVGAGAGKRAFGMVNGSGSSGSTPGSDVYDPTVPRVGKWADEEVAFRDNLVVHFVSGSLPLPNELKLCEFLSNMLKSKPSRLTKKMKKANLSTRHFFGNSGHIEDVELARELSRLEQSFVNSIVEPVERSEIKFHMQREWRDYLATLCAHMKISFKATEYLKSIENMENRIALARTRDRSVKRRLMMGKAIDHDAAAAQSTPGIFIDQSEGHNDGIDFDLLESAMQTNDYDDDDFRNLYLSLVDDNHGTLPQPPTQQRTVSENTENTENNSSDNASQWSSDTDPMHTAVQNVSTREGLLMSSAAPNFKFAAPFLAKVASYIEANCLPFEHIDIWVPTTAQMGDLSGAPSLQPCLGSGALDNQHAKLCFAGSYSLDVHMVNAETSTPKQTRLPPESVYNLLLFGSYSEKFSFSVGCGLPGRVYESGIPAWEQFITNAPNHLFERRGGAMQFGVKTAVGLPIDSPNGGRIVLVLYSGQDRSKNDQLVAQVINDLQMLKPCPRWKLVVELRSSNDAVLNADIQRSSASSAISHGSSNVSGEVNEASVIKSSRINELISILGENMPTNFSSPLGHQINDMMSLRLVLLKSAGRTPEEEQLVDSILLLFESYLKAGRSRSDISQMVTRDYAFHLGEQNQWRTRSASCSSQLHSMQIGSPKL